MRTLVLRALGALALAAGPSVLAAPAAQAGGLGCGFGSHCYTPPPVASCGADCYRYVSRPPVYGTVSEQVLVRPARTVTETIPPAFDTVSERVLVAPARRVWQVTRDAYGQPLGCWVTVPAQYAVQTRRVMVRPPQIVPHVIPPAYATYNRRVLVEPGRAGWVPAGGAPGIGGEGGFLGAGAGVIGAGLGLAGAGVGAGLSLAGAGGPYGEGF